jgi:hypothetical protein
MSQDIDRAFAAKTTALARYNQVNATGKALAQQLRDSRTFEALAQVAVQVPPFEEAMRGARAALTEVGTQLKALQTQVVDHGHPEASTLLARLEIARSEVDKGSFFGEVISLQEVCAQARMPCGQSSQPSAPWGTQIPGRSKTVSWEKVASDSPRFARRPMMITDADARGPARPRRWPRGLPDVAHARGRE